MQLPIQVSSSKCRVKSRYASKLIAARALSANNTKTTRCVSKSKALWLMQRAGSIGMVARICQSFVVARSRRGYRHGEGSGLR